MMIITAGVAVALVCFILYALDRKSKNEPIAWDSAGKLSLFGGLITSGIVFATTSDIPATVEAVSNVIPDAAQDMFVGKPTF